MSAELTDLERASIARIMQDRFPDFRIDGLVVTGRERTGVGVFVNLMDRLAQPLPDGVYQNAEATIEMEGLRFGVDFAVTATDNRIAFLELVTPDPAGWDGVQRPWRIVS